MSRILEVVGLFAILFAHTGNAMAQEPEAIDAERAWEVVVSLGAPAGGPADEIEAAMTASGFGDPGGFVDDPIEHPFSSGTEAEWAASLRRRVRPRMAGGRAVPRDRRSRLRGRV